MRLAFYKNICKVFVEIFVKLILGQNNKWFVL